MMTGDGEKTILLVEDEALIAMSEAMTLKKYGYKVVTVRTGEKAVEAVETSPEIDLVLMDINLGRGIDGTQAAAMILKQRDLPLIFLSSHTESEVVERTEGITSYGYIVKNSGEMVLIASIKMAFRLFEARMKEKEKDEALRARETQLSLIHDNVYDVVFAIGVEPNDHFRFTSVNRKFMDVTGLPEDQVVGKLVQEVIPEPARALVIGKYQEAIRNRQPAHWEEVSVYPAGTRVGEVTVAPIFDANGNCTQLIGTVHDITERKRTEEALHESEQRYQALFEQAGDGAFILDTNARIISVNESLARLHGFTVEEILRMGLEGLDVEGAAPAPDRVRRMMAGETLAFEVEHYHKDGHIFPLLVTANLISSGGERLILAVHRDITAQKRAEHELRERVKELRAFYRLAEITEREGITLDQLYHEFTNILPDSFQFPEIACAGIVIDGSEFRTQHFMESAWKLSAPVKVHGAVVGRIEVGYLEERPEAGEGPFLKEERLLINAIAERVGRITERKRAEEALHASQERLQAILDNTSLLVYVKDLEGRLTLVDREFESLFGLPREELVGKTSHDLMSKEVADTHRANDLEVIAKRMPVSVEEVNDEPDGRHTYLSTKFPLFDAAGEIYSICGISTDITERKQAETHNRLVAEVQSILLRPCKLEDIYRLVSEKAKQLIGDGITATSILDEQQQTVRMAASHGLDVPLGKIFSMLGFDPMQRAIPLADMSEEELKLYRSGRLEIIKEGLYALIAHMAPRPVCRVIEKLLRIQNIYAMGFIRNNEHLGGLIILARNDITPHIAAIEQIVNVAAIAVERTHAEEALARALNEKDTLLHEIQHRVKNTLAMIDSLVCLEAKHSAEPGVQATLEKLHRRIYTVANLYGTLYARGDVQAVRLDTYLAEIAQSLVGTFAGSWKRVELRLDLDELTVGPKSASALGLILNELITNAIKYAFPGDRHGFVGMRLKREGSDVVLEVADDGVGLPGDFDLTQTPGLGLKLVRILAEQLDGEAYCECAETTRFGIRANAKNLL